MPDAEPTEGPILAANKWRTNGDLIYDAARLGYLSPEWAILDPTYGRGNWWTVFHPLNLTKHDIALDGVDFRKLPEAHETFDAAVFDPPYIAPGGRKTSTIGDFNDRYGLHKTPRRPEGLQRMNNAGLVELWRVVKPRGYVLAKCKDYINGGRLFPATHLTLIAAFGIGFDLADRLEHISRPGPTPPHKTQQHARRNLSTLLVLKKPGPPR